MSSGRIKPAPQSSSVNGCTTMGFSELSATFLSALKLTQGRPAEYLAAVRVRPKHACLGELF